MPQLKTVANSASVEEFLETIVNEKRRQDSYVILELFKKITQQEAIMWGDAIVGFGSYKLNYKSGREVEWMRLGFSPRRQALTIYIMTGFTKLEPYLANLGKAKNSKSCLYIKRIEDVDLDALESLVRESLRLLAERWD